MAEISFQCVDIYPESHVAGRNCGTDLRVGDTFTAITRIVFSPTNPPEPLITPPAEFVAQIALRLDSIKAYDRSMDFLPSGMTALLGLSGSGFQLLSEFVADAPARTYYSLSVDAR